MRRTLPDDFCGPSTRRIVVPSPQSSQVFAWIRLQSPRGQRFPHVRAPALKTNDGLLGEFGKNHPIAGGEAPAS